MIKNNTNDGIDKWCNKAFSNNILFVLDGSLTIEDSEYSHNSGQYCFHIKTYNTDVTIHNSTFTDNSGYGLLMAGEKSLEISGSRFLNNKLENFYGNTVFRAEMGNRVMLREGNTFSANTSTVFDLYSSSMNIEKNNLFSNNLKGIDSANSSIEANGAEFIENGSFAIYTDSPWLTIDNTVFKGTADGAAVQIREERESVFVCTAMTRNYGLNNTGQKNVTITNSIFEDNKEGALSIADLPRAYANRYYGEFQIYIDNTSFINNTRSGKEKTDVYASDFFAGAGIYAGDLAHVHMRNLLLNGNTAATLGGSIAAGGTGRLILHPRYGGSVFDNHVNSSGHESDDIYLLNSESPYLISETMSSGGSHNWKQDKSVTGFMPEYVPEVSYREYIGDLDPEEIEEIELYCQDRPFECRVVDGWAENLIWNAVDREVTGFTMHSQPDRVDVPEDTYVIVQNNTALSVDGNPAYGGGIAVNGILEIGEPGITLNIRKIWNSGNNSDSPILTPEEFLPMLRLYADEGPFVLGTLTLADHTTDSEGTDIYRFKAENDRFVLIKLEDKHDHTYQISIENLPAETDGRTVVYTIEEDMDLFDSKISGDMESGFEIVNTMRPEPTPDPTPEPEPTALSPLFFLLESESLPKTGF